MSVELRDLAWAKLETQGGEPCARREAAAAAPNRPARRPHLRVVDSLLRRIR